MLMTVSWCLISSLRDQQTRKYTHILAKMKNTSHFFGLYFQFLSITPIRRLAGGAVVEDGGDDDIDEVGNPHRHTGAGVARDGKC